MENERKRLEIEAKKEAAEDAFFASWDRKFSGVRIQAITRKFGHSELTLGDELFEISHWKDISSIWLKGQSVVVTKSHDSFYPIKIRNLDNGEVAFARRSR